MARVQLERANVEEDEEPTYLVTVYPEGANEVWTFEVKPVYGIDITSILGAVKSAETATAEKRTW